MMQTLVLCSLALASLAAARPQQYNQYQQQQYYQQQPQAYQQQYYQQQQQQQQFGFRQEDASSSTTPIPILSYVNEINPDGSYHYSYETGNGIKADESGKINNPGAENEALAVQGAYSYIGDDGQTYSVQYTADENGFVPQGAHLPTPVPIPAELQKAIDEHLAALATAQPEEASTPEQHLFQQRQHFSG